MSRRRWEPIAGLDTPQALNLLDEELSLLDRGLRNVEAAAASQVRETSQVQDTSLEALVWWLS